MPYSKVVRLLKDLPITLAWCLPTETLLWAAAARLAGLDPARDFPKLRAFLVAGEPLTDSRRKRIEEIWGGIDVYQDYGSTETGSLAGECRHKRLHPWQDQIFFEIIDGRLVVTPLDREAMPLVRYLVGDYAEVDQSRCSCGSAFSVLRIWGRTESQLHALQAEAAVYGLPIEFGVLFWRAKCGTPVWEFEIEVEPKWANEATASLEKALERQQVPVRASVRAVMPGALVSEQILTQPAKFLKPNFVFEVGEPWGRAVLY